VMAPIGVWYSRSATAAKALLRSLLVHWVTSVILRVPPVLGALGILHSPDPSVLLILILGGRQLWARRWRHPRVAHCRTRGPARHPPRCEGRPCRLDDPTGC
jgi:hypothetical protein